MSLSQSFHTPRAPYSQQGSRSQRMVPLPRYLLPTAATNAAVAATSRESSSRGSHQITPHSNALVLSTLDTNKLRSAMSTGSAIVPYSILTGALSEQYVTEGGYVPYDVTRNRYAEFVREMTGQNEKQFTSPTIFAESLMRSIDCKANGSAAMRVAAATWALDLLASQPGNEVLLSIRDTLLPAIYMQYSEHGLQRLAPTVRGSLGATFSETIIAQNPIFSHEMFVENFLTREAQNAVALQYKGKLQRIGESRRSVLQRLLESNSMGIKSFLFRVWRGYTRRRKIERIGKYNRENRVEKHERTMVLQNSFHVWKSNVERSRSIFLTERLHNAASQLENAKNQYQLQCFRSDKHLTTVEELRAEVTSARAEMDKMKEELRETERRLKNHDMESNSTLNDHVTTILRDLATWRRFGRRCVEALSIYDVTVRSLEEQQRTLADILQNSDDDQPSSSPSAQPIMTTDTLANNSEAVILAWCRSVLAQSVASPVTTISNFTTDFQTGVVMLVLLHHVFTTDVPLNALQETNVSKRLEKLVQIFSRVGVGHIPRVSDFVECNGDIMYVILSELFSRDIQQQSLRKAKELIDGSYTGLEDPLGETLQYDAAMLPAVLEDSRIELRQFVDEERRLRAQSGTLLKCQETVSREAAFLIRERLSGNPVRAIGKSNVQKYWKIKLSRYSDLEVKFRVKDDGWREHWGASLRKVLQKHVHTTSRLYFSYGNSATHMNEVHFWRLALFFKLYEKPLSAANVERIFQTVAKQLPNNHELLEAPENVTLQELSPQDFIEVLVRIAESKFTQKTLAERLDNLLVMLAKLHSQRNDSVFHRETFSDASLQIFDRYLVDLVRTFLFYCRKGQRSAVGRLLSITMPVDAALTMFEDIGASKKATSSSGASGHSPIQDHDETTAHAAFITPTEIRAIVRRVTFESAGGNIAAAQQQLEPFFGDFLEILAAVSVYKTPDPSISLDKKLEILLSFVLARLRPKVRVGGVILSDVKMVV